MPDHGRDLHRTRDNHRMTGAAAAVGHDAERRAAIDAGGFGGRNVLGHDDALLHQLAQVQRRLAEEHAQHAAGHVLDVGGALAQVLVVDLGEGLDVALRHVVEAGLDVQPAGLEQPDGLADQRLILEHHLVRVENQRLLLAQVLLTCACIWAICCRVVTSACSKRAISAARLPASTV